MTATMATKWDVRVLALAGAGLMSLAGVFLWRELQVPHELLLAVTAVLASAVALAEVPRHRPLAGPILLLLTGLGGGLWYAAVKSGLLSLEQACARYSLSEEEFQSWQRLIEAHGMRALRTTRLQDYR